VKRKLTLFTLVITACLCLSGCENENDTIEIYNKDATVMDNIFINIKEGYFYNRHEKCTVDENTVAVTIYFSNSDDAEWSDNE
jgi:hypothetical protein